MHILIAGGTGLIGQALIRQLLLQGHEVTILSRNPQKLEAEMPGVSLLKWDGRSSKGWGHIIEETDAVINLAGASIAGEGLLNIVTQRWNRENKRRIQQSRVNAGQAIVQAIEAADNKPQVLVQASAVGYYGPRDSEDVAEGSPPGTDYLAQVCVDWENCTKAVEEMGVRRVVIRTGLILTEDGGILPIMLLPFRLFVGGPVGSGKQGVSWIHMQDEVQAIIYLIENETAQGVYNLTAPKPVTYAEFGKTAGKVMKRPSFIPVPSFALKMVLGEKSMLVLDGQRVVPSRLLEAGFNFRFAELQPALQNLLA